MGPSASGKTGLAVKLAELLDGEIVSADSRLIYKDLNIATAKPDNEERNGILHHLVDIKSPSEDYTVAEFADDAKIAVASIIDKGKTPIVAGGTGLYFRILLENYDLPRVAPNEALRVRLNQKSNEELYAQLCELDKTIATKIHENNRVKIIRALEVCISLGIPMSEAQGKKEGDFDTLWIGLNAKNRTFLYDRINVRVDIMLQKGLIEEAKNLLEKYGNLDLFHNTIGYQELFPYFNNECPLAVATDLIKQNTRRYAKRQLSWFRANKDINWFNIDELSENQIVDNILTLWKQV